MTEPKITVSGNKLTIETTLDAVGALSKSGKTMLVAKTDGMCKVKTDTSDIFVSLNVYRKVEA